MEVVVTAKEGAPVSTFLIPLKLVSDAAAGLAVNVAPIKFKAPAAVAVLVLVRVRESAKEPVLAKVAAPVMAIVLRKVAAPVTSRVPV